jgi:DNA polymerase (family X)
MPQLNKFKVKAFRTAAGTVANLETEIAVMVERGEVLTVLPGVGKGVSGVLTELVQTGALHSLEERLTNADPTVRELLEYPLLDPAKLKRAYQKLEISNLEELKAALLNGSALEKLGKRLEFQLKQALLNAPRQLLSDAEPIAEAIATALRKVAGVAQVAITGDVRRGEDTVGSISLLVNTKDVDAVKSRLARHGEVAEILDADQSQVELQLKNGLPGRIKFAESKQWGIELIKETGSALHLKALADAGHDLSSNQFVSGSFSDESAVYRAVNLTLIDPELREGRGEIEAAATGKLPQLITFENLRGDLHSHTTSSDGANTLEEMARAAKAKGYSYLGISDHSVNLKITNGLSSERLLEQIKIIDQLNGKLTGIQLLKSAEVDILEDGALDYPDEVLNELDYTICSIHSRFSKSLKEQTERILRAMDNRHFNILGHATGRLLLKREPYDLDIERIFNHAKASGCYFEINASPDRLDLNDEHAKMAKDLGTKIAINTDAHSIRELDFMPCGVTQARRGWLTADDVLNTRSWEELRKLLKR